MRKLPVGYGLCWTDRNCSAAQIWIQSQSDSALEIEQTSVLEFLWDRQILKLLFYTPWCNLKKALPDLHKAPFESLAPSQFPFSLFCAILHVL